MINILKFLIPALLPAYFAISSPNAAAYEFEFLGMGQPIHDQLTEMALRCIIENEGDTFTNCEKFKPSTKVKTLQVNVFEMKDLSVNDLVLATRWPDDPVRELRAYKILKMPLWSVHMRYIKCKGKNNGLKDGLRCSSHYGPAQFLHAMEGSPQKKPIDTQNAILDWAQFAYQIAINQYENGKYFAEEDYCSYFSKMGSDKYFKKVMYPNDGKDFPCNENDDTPWRVSTPFSFSCSIKVYNCREWNGVNDMRVRQAALGAILHSIQDSFAKGHASRGDESIETINIYNCKPIKQFQVYGEQNTDKHTAADVKAIPSENCLNPSLEDNGVHGPITASAHIIRLFKDKAPPHVVRAYLNKHVFVLDEDASLADSTDYFRKK